jgi:hypothetical protein
VGPAQGPTVGYIVLESAITVDVGVGSLDLDCRVYISETEASDFGSVSHIPSSSSFFAPPALYFL